MSIVHRSQYGAQITVKQNSESCAVDLEDGHNVREWQTKPILRMCHSTPTHLIYIVMCDFNMTTIGTPPLRGGVNSTWLGQ